MCEINVLAARLTKSSMRLRTHMFADIEHAYYNVCKSTLSHPIKSKSKVQRQMTQTPTPNPDVQAVFDRYSPEIQDRLMMLRALIYSTASEIEEVGEIEEALKWGQPSYLTPVSRSGTTIRIDRVKTNPTQCAIYVHCQTSLIETFRAMYPDLSYDGSRAIIFDAVDALPIDAVKDCIAMALTYHLRRD